jgi:predicted acyl esterase
MRIVLCIALFSSGFYVQAQQSVSDSLFIRRHYNKFEYQIPMRDGIKLFTVVYIPKDKSKQYPILLNRTCYNASNYANYYTGSHPSGFLVEDMYILAFQDVRGRYMSDGSFDNMRPNVPGNDLRNKTAIDESSDTWDTIDWMIKNIKGKQR